MPSGSVPNQDRQKGEKPIITLLTYLRREDLSECVIARYEHTDSEGTPILAKSFCLRKIENNSNVEVKMSLSYASCRAALPSDRKVHNHCK